MPFFIIYGMKLANFKAKYPQIKARYPESEVERQNGKFIINITISVILLVLGVTIMVLASGMHIFNNDSPLPATLLMVFVTASLPLSVFANIQHHKYNINKYNHTKTSSYWLHYQLILSNPPENQFRQKRFMSLSKSNQ